jgi:hypothetical protein
MLSYKNPERELAGLVDDNDQLLRLFHHRTWAHAENYSKRKRCGQASPLYPNWPAMHRIIDIEKCIAMFSLHCV